MPLLAHRRCRNCVPSHMTAADFIALVPPAGSDRVICNVICNAPLFSRPSLVCASRPCLPSSSCRCLLQLPSLPGCVYRCGGGRVRRCIASPPSRRTGPCLASPEETGHGGGARRTLCATAPHSVAFAVAFVGASLLVFGASLLVFGASLFVSPRQSADERHDVLYYT